MKKNVRIAMLVLRMIVTGMLTFIVVYNILKGEVMWAVLNMQILLMYLFVEEKGQRLEDECFDMEFKHLMIQSQIKTMNAVKSLVDKDAEAAKEVLEKMQPKRRGRKPRSE